MTPRDFVFWMRGFLELTGETKITPEQVKMINDHIDLVFDELKNKPLTSQAAYDLLSRPISSVC